MFFRHLYDASYVLPDDGPVMLSEAYSAGAIGDSLRLLLVYDDASFAKRASSVVSESGLQVMKFLLRTWASGYLV